MKDYRKKPVVIQAERFFPDKHGTATYPLTLNMVQPPRDVSPCARESCAGVAHLEIPTYEGVMFACPGDWIIRGVQGEYYPCKPDIFEATYDEV